MERLLGQPEGNFRQPRSHALTEGLGGFFNGATSRLAEPPE